MKYEAALNVVLHQPEIPQNTGNIGRTCVAIRAKLWLVRPLGFRMDESHLRRAGLDYWKSLEWEMVDDWDALIRRMPAQRLWLYSKKAEKLYTDVSYEQGDALVFGCETRGLPTTLLDDHADRALRIPVEPPVRSLNLANAVAVAAYEALRQWRIDA